MKTKNRFFLVVAIIILIFGCSRDSASKEQTTNNKNETVFSEDEVDTGIKKTNPKVAFEMVVNDDNVRMRENPDLSSNIITTLNKNSKVTFITKTISTDVIDNMNTCWYKVALDDRKTEGWVYGHYLSSNYGIKIKNGEIRNTLSIPSLNNKIMSLGDEFLDELENKSVNKPLLISQYNGFGLAFPITDDEKKDFQLDNPYDNYYYTDLSVEIIAKYGNQTFSKTEKLALFHSYDSKDIICYCVPYISFENKFWINNSEKWEINAILPNGKTYQLDYKTKNNSILYEKEIITPFEQSAPEGKRLRRNIEYTYRFLANTPKVVVVFHTEDEFVYEPLLQIYNDNAGNDRQIIFEWTDEAMSGTYYITDFDINALPKDDNLYAIFNYQTLE